MIYVLLCRNTSSLIPWEIETIRFDFFWLLLFFFNKPFPTILVAERYSILFCSKLKLHIRQRISAVKRICNSITRKYNCNYLEIQFSYEYSHVEVQPINGFSQRSRVSKLICQLWVLSVPDCIAFLVTRPIRTSRPLMCSSGTPVIGEISSCEQKNQTILFT